MRKTAASIFIVIYLAFSSAASANFIDVVPQSIFYNAVQYFSYDFPIISLEQDSFSPLTPVTKAEFYKLILASAGYRPHSGAIECPECSDINGDEWFAPYAKKALEQNILSCHESDGMFNAGNSITRAEGLKIIFKLYGIPALEPGMGTGMYHDVEKTDPYAGVAQTAYELNLLSDYKSGYFLADKLLTRAETVNILYGIHGFVDYLPDIGEFSDYIYSSDITNLSTYSTFIDVWNRITNEYIEKNSLDKEQLLYGAISGMVNKVGDPYTIFFEPTDSVSYWESLNGSFEGIGIYLNETNEQIEIITPLKGSPAEQAGIKPGDIILEIDGQSTSEMSLDELIQKLRGPAGTKVTLKLQREYSTLSITVTRAQIDIPYVEGEIKDGIGIINYYQFTANSHDQFVSELQKIIEQKPKGLILDMRNNPGGYLFSSQDLISHFTLKNTVFIKLIFADGTSQTEKSLGPGELKNYPLVILINEGSASASEIVALALKDLNKAKIVGTNSYGKGRIQEIINYNDNSSLKISTAKWISPAGTYIEGVGITPDYSIELSDSDVAQNLDPQMDKAIQILKNL